MNYFYDFADIIWFPTVYIRIVIKFVDFREVQYRQPIPKTH